MAIHVHFTIEEGELRRLDAWAAERDISRSRAIVALLDLATGETETREQRRARDRGLLARAPTDVRADPPMPGRVVDYDDQISQQRAIQPGKQQWGSIEVSRRELGRAVLASAEAKVGVKPTTDTDLEEPW